MSCFIVGFSPPNKSTVSQSYLTSHLPPPPCPTESVHLCCVTILGCIVVWYEGPDCICFGICRYWILPDLSFVISNSIVLNAFSLSSGLGTLCTSILYLLTLHIYCSQTRTSYSMLGSCQNFSLEGVNDLQTLPVYDEWSMNDFAGKSEGYNKF